MHGRPGGRLGLQPRHHLPQHVPGLLDCLAGLRRRVDAIEPDGRLVPNDGRLDVRVVREPVEIVFGRDIDLGAPELTVAAGAGARLYADVFGLPLLDADHPSPATLVRCAIARVRAGAPSDPLTPLYLRHPDAVVPTSTKTVSQ